MKNTSASVAARSNGGFVPLTEDEWAARWKVGLAPLLREHQRRERMKFTFGLLTGVLIGVLLAVLVLWQVA